MDRLQRKVAIVTGAAAGIGSATAEHTLLLTGRW
jgi:NADP-dependent 3-hydroxy acid dehydrogenase YdfG